MPSVPVEPSVSSAKADSRPSRPSLRIRPGTSSHAADDPPSDIKLDELDSTFQLSEYLDVLVRRGERVGELVRLPREGAAEDGEGWEVDESLWLYVHLLRLPRDLTPLVVALLEVCTPETCPSMLAQHWNYLCSVHPGPTRECPAIDYILHTLEQTTHVLTSSRLFPSRMSISSSARVQLDNVARRLARFFGHAYHHHPEAFEACEAETDLCARLVNLIAAFNLVPLEDVPLPTELFVLPSASSSDSSESDDGSSDDEDEDASGRAEDKEEGEEEDDEDFVPRRAEGAQKGVLLDFGSAGEEEDDDDDNDERHDDGDSEGEQDDDDEEKWAHERGSPDADAVAAPTLDFDPAPSPALEPADLDPSPTSASNGSSSPPTPADSPEPEDEVPMAMAGGDKRWSVAVGGSED